MDEKQFEGFLGKLEEIQASCELYYASESLAMFNLANEDLRVYGLDRLENQLISRNHKKLSDNLERVSPHDSENYYESINKSINVLIFELEDEILEAGLKIGENYLIGDEPLFQFYPDDEGNQLAFLFCPEGEYREEVKLLMGKEDFDYLFDEAVHIIFEGCCAQGEENTKFDNAFSFLETEVSKDYIAFKTPVGAISDGATWINTAEFLMRNSKLYQDNLG